MLRKGFSHVSCCLSFPLLDRIGIILRHIVLLVQPFYKIWIPSITFSLYFVDCYAITRERPP